MLGCELQGEELRVVVDAPWHGDTPPMSAPGSTNALWEYEVVEFFLLGSHEHYLEIELGPHGHYLVLELAGRRTPIRTHLPLTYQVEHLGERWRGTTTVPLHYLPPELAHANAYAIHGLGAERRYLACYPVPGATADFHRLECFGALERAFTDELAEARAARAGR